MNPPLWFDARVGIDLTVFWEDGERIFCRARRDGADGDCKSVLTILLAVEHPTPDSLKRLTNEYALKGELDDAWAVRPLDLVREGGRTLLVLKDPGAVPLDRLSGSPMAIPQSLALPTPLSSALAHSPHRVPIP